MMLPEATQNTRSNGGLAPTQTFPSPTTDFSKSPDSHYSSILEYWMMVSHIIYHNLVWGLEKEKVSGYTLGSP